MYLKKDVFKEEIVFKNTSHNFSQYCGEKRLGSGSKFQQIPRSGSKFGSTTTLFPTEKPHPALQVVPDKDLVVDVELVVLDKGGRGRVGPLDLAHVLAQLGPALPGPPAQVLTATRWS